MAVNEYLPSWSYQYLRIPENPNDVLDECISKIPQPYRDETVDRFFIELLPGKCSYLGIEYPYYDTDFSSLYYSYYVKTFRKFNKECCRIILYGDNDSCLGYVVLRPLPKGKKIGKTYLDPTVFAEGNCYIICGPHKLHYLGEEAVVNAMPYMQQETSVTICAHVCLWSLTRFFSSRFSNRASCTIGDIAERIASPIERKTPSNGLTPQQISALLIDLGFDSIIVRSGAPTSLGEQLCAYLDSGLPVICVSSSRKHAVVACGRTPVSPEQAKEACAISKFKFAGIPPLEKSKVFLVFESSMVTSFVINDDCEKMPYKTIYTETRTTESSCIKDELSSQVATEYTSLSARDIDACIVPLDPQMQLDYVKAKELIKFLFDDKYYTESKTAHSIHISALSLVTANTFKEWIRGNLLNGTLPPAFRQLLGISYPKFLWLGTFALLEEYCNGKCSGFIVLDPTCAINDESTCLLIADHRSCRIRHNSSELEGKSPRFGFPSSKFSIPLFKNNYVEVRKHE